MKKNLLYIVALLFIQTITAATPPSKNPLREYEYLKKQNKLTITLIKEALDFVKTGEKQIKAKLFLRTLNEQEKYNLEFQEETESLLSIYKQIQKTIKILTQEFNQKINERQSYPDSTTNLITSPRARKWESLRPSPIKIPEYIHEENTDGYESDDTKDSFINDVD